MCQECGFITGHANTCPNNPDIYEPVMVECPLCGEEYTDEDMMYVVCDECISRNTTFAQGIKFGADNQATVKINGLYAKLLSPEQIEVSLQVAAVAINQYYPRFAEKAVREFVSDDDSAFADWLKGEKK